MADFVKGGGGGGTPVQYSDFRGINMTPVIARCFERTVYRHVTTIRISL